MKDILDDVTLEHLSAVSEEQRDIAEIIGLEAYRRLVEYAGGGFIYITQSKTLSRVLRDEEIRKDVYKRQLISIIKQHCNKGQYSI